MDFTQLSCREFVTVLSSSEPVPGGGGAAALVGAVGTALGNMVGSLTVGKKKYADVEEEILALMEKCSELEQQLLDQVKADADGFRPLAEAYSLPKEDPDRKLKLEEAAKAACAVPVRIMELSAEAIEAAEKFAEKGSLLAVSDAGCAAVCLKAALEAASLNVYINTKGLKDRDFARRMNSKCEKLLKEYGARADRIFEGIKASFFV